MTGIDQRLRAVAASIVAVVFFAAQLAITAYACPYTAGVSMPHAQMSSDCGSGAGATDQPNLCKAHNDTQAQIKSEQLPTPPITQIIVASPSPLSVATIAPSAARTRAYAKSLLATRSSPPLFIRFQVFLR
jgi:hypothetical protein